MEFSNKTTLKLFNPELQTRKLIVEFSIGSGTLYSIIPEDIIKDLELKPFASISIRHLNGIAEKVKLYQVGMEAGNLRINSTPAIAKGDSCQIGKLTLLQAGLLLDPLEGKLRQVELLAPEDPIFHDFISVWVPAVYKSILSLATARETYSEIIEYYNDLIDYLRNYGKPDVDSSLVTSLIVVSFPQAASMIASYLSGMIPHCNLSIRLTLEAVTAAYFADTLISNGRYANIDSFYIWRKVIKRIDNKGFRNFCKDKLSKALPKDVTNDIVRLWNNTSGSWLHIAGLLRRMTKSPDVTSLAMGPFLAYDNNDIHDLRVLKDNVQSLRRIMTNLFEEWSKLKKESR